VEPGAEESFQSCGSLSRHLPETRPTGHTTDRPATEGVDPDQVAEDLIQFMNRKVWDVVWEQGDDEDHNAVT
jgi:hypothetical protein